MVVFLMAEVALRAGWWTIEQSYNLGYYMMYGTEETKEEKILKQIEELKEEIKKEREEMKSLQIDDYIKYKKEYDTKKNKENITSQNMFDVLEEETE